jgi:hypothetical protein
VVISLIVTSGGWGARRTEQSISQQQCGDVVLADPEHGYAPIAGFHFRVLASSFRAEMRPIMLGRGFVAQHR